MFRWACCRLSPAHPGFSHSKVRNFFQGQRKVKELFLFLASHQVWESVPSLAKVNVVSKYIYKGIILISVILSLALMVEKLSSMDFGLTGQ